MFAKDQRMFFLLVKIAPRDRYFLLILDIQTFCGLVSKFSILKKILKTNMRFQNMTRAIKLLVAQQTQGAAIGLL